MEAAGPISLPLPAFIITRSFRPILPGTRAKMGQNDTYAASMLIILGTAGPYCAIYAVVMILASGAAAFMDTGEKRKQYVIFLICTLIPLLLYILSNSFAVEEHAGATGRSLGEILKDFPTFPIRFILKSLAGMMVGGEELQQWIANGCISNKIIYLLGVILMVGYLWSLWLNISLGIYKKTFFPLILLVSGGAIIFSSSFHVTFLKKKIMP